MEEIDETEQWVMSHYRRWLHLVQAKDVAALLLLAYLVKELDLKQARIPGQKDRTKPRQQVRSWVVFLCSAS